MPGDAPDAMLYTPSEANAGTDEMTLVKPNEGPPVDPTFPADYERHEEVGRGGMGVVYRATETALKRAVAVKLLLDKFETGGTVAARFMEEAQIAARLQHPGIPPVYRVGFLPSGRPFMVMKLIRGAARTEKPQTFADELRKRKTLADERLKYIHVFWQICQAVGYAHDRNVIHRDLKPANVMIGAFGEVQVMDWGLGKVLSGTDAPDAPGTGDSISLIASPRDPDAAESQTGAVHGTPAYMPPEQALGKIKKLCPASDVFGLGAILCTILTGTPPYSGASALARAGAWDVEDAFERLGVCGADAELIALAKWCLAKEPKQRPANGGEVAEAVKQWRLAADERARLAAIGEQTRHLYLLALDGFDRVVVDIYDRLAQRPGTLDLQEHVLRFAQEGLQKLVGEAEKSGSPDRAQVCTYLRLGGVELALGRNEDALNAYRAGNELAQRLFDALPSDPQTQRDLSRSFTGLGDTAMKLGRALEAQWHYERGREWCQRLADAAPDDRDVWRDLGISLEKLGDVALPLHGADEAWDYYRRAHEIRLRLVGSAPGDPQAQRELIVGLNRWGDVAQSLGRVEEARELHEQAQEVQQRPTNAHPDDAKFQRHLGTSLLRSGDEALQGGRHEEARAFYEQGLAVVRGLAAKDPNDVQAQGDLATSLERLGKVALRHGRADAARSLFEQELSTRRRLAEAAPGDAQLQRELGVSLNRLGEVVLSQDESDLARSLFEQSLEVVSRRAEEAPEDAPAQRDLLVSHYKLGIVAQKQRDFARARQRYQHALAVAQRFSRPQFFGAEVATLENCLAACREHLDGPAS